MAIRLWTYWNGSPARVTVTDRAVEYSSGYRHEEGWSSFTESHWIENGMVYRQSYTDGSDCDGRSSSATLCSCPLERLAHSVVDGIGYPDWEPVRRRQRDYSAEAMGY